MSQPGAKGTAVDPRERRRRGDAVEVARGTGFTAAGAVFEIANRFLIALILTRALGVSDYGLYTLAISVAVIFSGLADLGLDDAMVRYIAVQNGKRDDRGIWGTLQIGFGLPVLFGLANGAVLFLAAEPIAVGLFDEPGLISPLRIVAGVVPFLTISNVLLGAARGFQRMDYAAFGENVVQTAIRLVVLGILSVAGFGAITALVVFGISEAAASVTLIVLLNRVFPLRRPLTTEVRRDTREVMGFALPMWLAGLLSQARKNIQTIALGVFGVVADVGIFALAGRVNLVGRSFYRSVVVAVKPLLARGHDEGDRDRLTQIYEMATRWLLIVNLPFFLGMVLYPEAILSIFGSGFVSGASALVVLAWSELLNAATGVCGSMIDMGGYTRAKLANSVVWVTLQIVTSVLLIPPFGVLGAAYASLLSLGTVNLLRLVEVWWVDRILPFHAALWKPATAGLVAYGTGRGVDLIRPVGENVWAALWQGAIVTAVFVVLLIVFRLDEGDRMLLDRIVGRLRRRISRTRAT